MTLSIEELRQRHIALPGDVMLCPGCEAELLRFAGTTFRETTPLPAADERPGDAGGTKLYCRLCGEGSTLFSDAHGPYLSDAEWSAGLFRSGSWKGWRALSGE